SPEIVVTGNPQGNCADYGFTHTIATTGTYSAYVAYDDFYAAGPSSQYTLAWVDEEGVSTPVTSPLDYSLAQNYPNPFNPTTTIEFSLPVVTSVQLLIYDVTGRRVAVLVDDALAAGNHQVRFEAGGLPSGIYFYKMQAGAYWAVKKMILIK
ncbi:MAG: T9SS type A sorting domain-containing protein, partial [Candidatus Delongbacteria bacterium]|nr:T9SS type A sorting domain-containing protein [Candidatus Delongbacteria bacterium]